MEITACQHLQEEGATPEVDNPRQAGWSTGGIGGLVVASYKRMGVDF